MTRLIGSGVRGSVLGLLLVFPALMVLAPQQSVAQGKETSRTVRGHVSHKDGSAVKGAIVHLKDLRGLSQKSYITPDNGEYRFGALNGTTDYEIWAEFEGKKSSVKHISSFDAKNTFDIALTID